jgi:hypothetical protein
LGARAITGSIGIVIKGRIRPAPLIWNHYECFLSLEPLQEVTVLVPTRWIPNIYRLLLHEVRLVIRLLSRPRIRLQLNLPQPFLLGRGLYLGLLMQLLVKFVDHDFVIYCLMLMDLLNELGALV